MDRRMLKDSQWEKLPLCCQENLLIKVGEQPIIANL